MQRRSIFALLFALLLSACTGQNVVLLKEADSLANTSKDLVVRLKSFYAEQSKRLTDDLIDIVASDENCRADSPVYLMRAASTEPWKCLSQKTKEDCQKAPDRCKDKLIVIDLVKRDSLNRTLIAYIDALTTYQSALTKIVAEDAPDAGTRLLAARKRLVGLKEGLVKADLLPDAGDEDPLGEAAQAQSEAIGALVSLIHEGMRAHADMAVLEKLMRAHGEDFQKSLDALIRHYQLVDQRGSLLVARAALEDRRMAYNRLVVSGKTKSMTKAQRFEMLKKIYDDEFELNQREAAPDPIVQALLALKRSESELRHAVLDGEFTASQRAAIAKENASQLKSALAAIAQVVKVLS